MSYLVLNVRPYDFKDDSGRRVQGASVSYLDLSVKASEGELGYSPLQLTCDPDIAKGFSDAPAFYDLSFGHRRGARGRPQLVLNGARLLARFDLEGFIEAEGGDVAV